MKNNVRDKDRDKEITTWKIWDCIILFKSKSDNQKLFWGGQTWFGRLHKCAPPHEVPWIYRFCENSSFHYSLMEAPWLLIIWATEPFHFFFFEKGSDSQLLDLRDVNVFTGIVVDLCRDASWCQKKHRKNSFSCSVQRCNPHLATMLKSRDI